MEAAKPRHRTAKDVMQEKLQEPSSAAISPAHARTCAGSSTSFDPPETARREGLLKGPSGHQTIWPPLSSGLRESRVLENSNQQALLEGRVSMVRHANRPRPTILDPDMMVSARTVEPEAVLAQKRSTSTTVSGFMSSPLRVSQYGRARRRR